MLARFFSIVMNHRAKKYIFNDSDFMGNNMFGEYIDRTKYVFCSNEFERIRTFEFDGIKVKGFENYDLFLSQWYGDYMKLPPEDKQVSNHDFIVYWN